MLDLEWKRGKSLKKWKLQETNVFCKGVMCVGEEERRKIAQYHKQFSEHSN